MSSNQRIAVSSSLSTLITVSTFTPFDVIKNTQIVSHRSLAFTEALRGVLSLRGIRGLWRGLTASLLSSGTNNMVYFLLYEHLHPKLSEQFGGIGFGMAAFMSRGLSVSLVSPIERFRTSLQANGSASFTVSTAGLRATIVRDVLFSGSLFTVKENFIGWQAIGLLAGGATAVVITQPFDVIKTKLQARRCCYSEFENKLIYGLRTIARTEGYQELMRGLGARLCKVCPSVLVYLTIYEQFKRTYI